MDNSSPPSSDQPQLVMHIRRSSMQHKWESSGSLVPARESRRKASLSFPISSSDLQNRFSQDSQLVFVSNPGALAASPAQSTTQPEINNDVGPKSSKQVLVDLERRVKKVEEHMKPISDSLDDLRSHLQSDKRGRTTHLNQVEKRIASLEQSMSERFEELKALLTNRVITPNTARRAEHRDPDMISSSRRAERRDSVTTDSPRRAERRDPVRTDSPRRAEHQDSGTINISRRAEHRDSVTTSSPRRAEHRDSTVTLPKNLQRSKPARIDRTSSFLLKRLKHGALAHEDHDKETRVNDTSRSSSILAKVFGIRGADIRNGIEGSRVIHPFSLFYTGEASVMLFLLIYSAVTIPLQLSFWYFSDDCKASPTLKFDVFVDCAFMCDVVVNFFVGYYGSEIVPQYHDGMLDIARNYITAPTGFFFDFFTSIPVSIVDLAVAQECALQGAENPSHPSAYLDAQSVQFMKILRVFKLVRIIKAIKFVTKLEDDVSQLIGPTLFKILQLFVLLCFSIHLFACLFWRVKLESDPDAIPGFLASKGVSPEDLDSVYIMCVYFIMTVFCTVGFGDITAGTRNEMVFCIFLFICGACLFGSLIAQINDVISSLSRDRREINDRLGTYIAFMKQYNVPHYVQKKVRTWVRYHFTQEQNENKTHMILLDPKLPDDFRVALAKCLHTALFAKVPYLVGVSQRTRDAFAAELLLRAKNVHVSTSSMVADSSEPADRLMVISSGSVEVCLPFKTANLDPRQIRGKKGQRLRVLTTGDVIGECGVIGDSRWAGGFGIDADYIALDECTLVCISNQDIEAVLQQFEFSPIRNRIDSARKLRERNLTEMKEESGLEASNRDAPPRPDNPKVVFDWVFMSHQLLQRARPGRRGPSQT